MTYVPRVTLNGTSTSWATVAARPSNANQGHLGWNETTGQVELYDAVAKVWRRISPATLSSSANKVAAGTTAGNYRNDYVSYTATTGTARGQYLRLYLDSGAGGEAGRFYTTVSSDTPADTVNGAHISLSFGASAGNVTGEANASRNTIAVPNRTLNGTNSAVNAEVWADGSSSGASNLSFLRCNLGGDGTGVTTLNGQVALLSLDGVTVGSAGDGKVVNAISGDKAVTHLAKILINGTAYWIMLRNAV